ncbi:hypothetical protein DENIS_0167 [Desulfonema ishimotonii]|uniref:Uncharacterized protein n=1 Tax=Desulfonema ishimotonii TaxID=45657 RepID=A0A401FQH4_9BACT|nr:hypothetical protein DENIS_0167 [Desulfonema ishimotonii]
MTLKLPKSDLLSGKEDSDEKNNKNTDTDSFIIINIHWQRTGCCIGWDDNKAYDF